MLPWVVLAIILAIGLAISVIYTAVEFYIHKDHVGGTLGLVIGLVLVGTSTHTNRSSLDRFPKIKITP